MSTQPPNIAVLPPQLIVGCRCCMAEYTRCVAPHCPALQSARSSMVANASWAYLQLGWSALHRLGEWVRLRLPSPGSAGSTTGSGEAAMSAWVACGGEGAEGACAVCWVDVAPGWRGFLTGSSFCVSVCAAVCHGWSCCHCTMVPCTVWPDRTGASWCATCECSVSCCCTCTTWPATSSRCADCSWSCDASTVTGGLDNWEVGIVINHGVLTWSLDCWVEPRQQG